MADIWEQLDEIGRSAPAEVWEDFQARVEATDIAICASCGQKMHPSDYNERKQAKINSLNKEIEGFQVALQVAFVQGAKWWEYKTTGATMWQSNQNAAEAEALKRAELHTLGVGHNVQIEGLADCKT